MCFAKIALSFFGCADEAKMGRLKADTGGDGEGGSGNCYQARTLNLNWTVMNRGVTEPCHQAMVQSAARTDGVAGPQ